MFTPRCGPPVAAALAVGGRVVPSSHPTQHSDLRGQGVTSQTEGDMGPQRDTPWKASSRWQPWAAPGPPCGAAGTASPRPFSVNGKCSWDVWAVWERAAWEGNAHVKHTTEEKHRDAARWRILKVEKFLRFRHKRKCYPCFYQEKWTRVIFLKNRQGFLKIQRCVPHGRTVKGPT